MKHNTLKSKNGDISLLYCHLQEKYHSWPQIHGISGRRLKKIASVTTSMLNSRYLCSIPFFLGLFCEKFWNTHNFGKFSRVPTRLAKNLEEIERGLRKVDTQFQVIIQKLEHILELQNKIRKILPPLRAPVKRAVHRWYRVVFYIVPPHFQDQHENNLAQPARRFLRCKISWKSQIAILVLKIGWSS